MPSTSQLCSSVQQAPRPSFSIVGPAKVAAAQADEFAGIGISPRADVDRPGWVKLQSAIERGDVAE